VRPLPSFHLGCATIPDVMSLPFLFLSKPFDTTLRVFGGGQGQVKPLRIVSTRRRYSDDLLLRVARRLAPNEDPVSPPRLTPLIAIIWTLIPLWSSDYFFSSSVLLVRMPETFTDPLCRHDVALNQGHTLKAIRMAASDRRGAVEYDRRGAVEYSRRRLGHNEYQIQNEEEEEEENEGENERGRGHGDWDGEWEEEEEGHGWRVERGHDAEINDRTLTTGMLSHEKWRAGGGGDPSDSSSGDEGQHVEPSAKYASLSRARLEVALHKSEVANDRLERIVQDILKAREAEAKTAERAARRDQLAMSELESRVVNGEAELEGRVRQLQEVRGISICYEDWMNM